MRLLIISDFTESFAYRLMKGIVNYSREHGQWEICRMPPAYKKAIGIAGVVDWAKRWEADAVIGQFDHNDNLSLFRDKGIVVIAQDYKRRFVNYPNITADYIETGSMAARLFLEKGFRNFGFFGFRDVCWSDERCQGFRQTVEQLGCCDSFALYQMQDIDNLWYYERETLKKWLNNLKKPVAIMACDDNQGSNLIDACNSIGIKIPDDVSVIGVDNDEMVCSLNTPMLSSIQIDIERGGYQTAELIDRLVNHPDSPVQDIVLKPVKVVDRISTASFATNDREIQMAVKFIHQNLHRKITVKDILAEVPLSRRLLERRFREVTKESIYQYITKMRVKLFAEMLIDTNEQVINIAINLGESDTKGIARKFKAQYGCTPGQWRELHKKQS